MELPASTQTLLCLEILGIRVPNTEFQDPDGEVTDPSREALAGI